VESTFNALMAPEGKVALGGVKKGTVSINSTATGFNFSYADVIRFGDVNFNNRSLVDVNGINAGSIQV
jgi:hypothetical protein